MRGEQGVNTECVCVCLCACAVFCIFNNSRVTDEIQFLENRKHNCFFV